ncbi:hydrogenase expression/formation protein [Malaciobacter halophilus]|uniref:Hydrogenase expression/formation protein n=1 Tax=Malaciobacter halophilus TaxID=197482 RepID=A0A2N1J070_9BACT|nr:HyaD/HybD family hydrogenase maturation endopeptidase [Malaciobacter halophilus]AXH09486.1 [Ni-Fe] hydrogenase maturation protease [Malaciobacter halophilus]PKI79941.1 hydrogenase expression/formation protein [Malaciobacter halophilus]
MNILILGIGNILFQDEGMGAHFVHYLDEKYEFKNEQNSVSIVDGGTLAHRLIPLIVKFDHVIVIDCVDALNSKPGDVYFFDFEHAPKEIDWQGSAHEIEMLQTLNMIQINGDLPKTHVLGIIPKRVDDDTTFELSDEVIKATTTMEHTIIKHLESLGVKPVLKKDDVTITDIAEVSYKREIINDPKI